MFSRKKVAEIVAEFLGGGLFTYAVVIALTKGALPAAWAGGLAILVGMLWFHRISGGHFNPAVTLGFWTAGKIKTLKAIVYIVAQFAGAYAAIKLYEWLTGAPIGAEGPDFAAKGMVSEMLGMFIWAFAVAAVVFRRVSANIAAAVVGLAVTLGILVAGGAAVGFLNPATAMTVFGSDSGTLGIYVVGPVLGAIVAINLYALVFDDEKASFKGALRAATGQATRSSSAKTTSQKASSASRAKSSTKKSTKR